MPTRGPCQKKLNAENVLKVTQINAMKPEHRIAFLEIQRVENIAKNGDENRAEEAQKFLTRLKNSGSAKGALAQPRALRVRESANPRALRVRESADTHAKTSICHSMFHF